jgi:enhancer of polycomb-like protein
MDRRNASPSSIERIRRSKLYEFDSQDVEMDKMDDENVQAIHERWRFDQDDVPAVGPGGPEEQNRILVDDFDIR